MQFSVALVCHLSLLLCTSATNNNGDADNAQNAHFGSDRTFVDRQSGFNIFTFAALPRARYFSPQAQGFMLFSVALVCHFLLLLCTSAANNNGDANNAQNAHFGSDRTFVDRHSGLSIFAFASLRRARYFSPQAKRFQQFSVALVCHFSLLVCTSAANNNGEARHGENAHFGSDRTFVDRHNSFNIYACCVCFWTPKKGPGSRFGS